MKKAQGTILVFDNDQQALATGMNALRREGFSVIGMADRSQARREIESGEVKFAVFHVRPSEEENELESSIMKLIGSKPSVPRIVVAHGEEAERQVHQFLRSSSRMAAARVMKGPIKNSAFVKALNSMLPGDETTDDEPPKPAHAAARKNTNRIR